MAGGQERILHRRIKRVQSTKKITLAMELIAATRVVKAQHRANGARPVRRADHAGHPRPGRRRRRASTTRCSARPEDVARVASSWCQLRPGPLPVATTPAVIRAAEREIDGRPLRRPGVRPHHSSAEGARATSASGTTASTPRSSASPTSPTYENAREIAEPVHGDVRRRRGRPRRPGLHRVPLGRHPSEVVVRRFLPLERTESVADAGPGAARRRLRVRAVARGDARRRCCPATSRPACSPPSSTPRRPSTPPASGP